MNKRVKIGAQKAVFMFISISAFMLLFSNFLENPVLLASFAASLFIIFGHPKADISCPRVIIGSHLIAAVVGYSLTFVPVGDLGMSPVLVIAGTAVGVSTFLMIVLDVRHPPAAATALSFSYHLGGGLDSWMTFLVALAMIVALGVVRGIWNFLGDILEEIEDDFEERKCKKH